LLGIRASLEAVLSSEGLALDADGEIFKEEESYEDSED
jgi:hypothetical protein